MRYLAEIEQVRRDVESEHDRMRPRPGLLTRRGIKRMAEELSGEDDCDVLSCKGVRVRILEVRKVQ